MDNFYNTFKFRFDNQFFNEPIELDNFILYQVGDLFCEYDTVIEDHPQDMQIELSFIENGAGKMYCDGYPVEVQSGEIFLSLAGDVHKITSNTADTMRYFYIAFDVKEGSALSAIKDFLTERHRDPKKRVFRFPYIFPQMTNILSEITYQNEFYRELIDDNLSQILVSLYRTSTNQITSFNKYEIDSRNSMIYNIAHYINNNLCSIQHLSDLAEKFSYDYSYMSKRFKTTMGKSMHAYFQEKKLEYAKQLLAQEHRSVTKVAEMLNYSSIHNFSRAFKNFYAVSPQEYAESCNSSSLPPPPPRPWKQTKQKNNARTVFTRNRSGVVLF